MAAEPAADLILVLFEPNPKSSRIRAHPRPRPCLTPEARINIPESLPAMDRMLPEMGHKENKPESLIAATGPHMENRCPFWIE